MSLAATTGRDDYTANGSVSEFTFTFAVYTKADLAVYANGVLQTLDTHYQALEPGGLPFGSLAAASLPSTGKVKFIDGSGNPLPPANGTKILLLRAQPVSQLSEYVANEAFPSLRLEKDLDKLIAVAQSLREHLGRAITFATASLFKDKALPDPTGTPKVIGFDGANNLVLYDLTTGAITGMVNPMSAEGDLIRGGVAGVAARLAKGTTGLPLVAGTTISDYTALTATGLAADAVETAKLKDANVTAAKLATDAVETAKIKDGNVTTAKILDGAVTAPKFRRFEGSAQNTSPVTVTSSLTTIVSLNCGTVSAGDRVFVQAQASINHTGAVGRILAQIATDTGTTATVQAGHDATVIAHDKEVPAFPALGGAFSLAGVFKVTGSGTLVLKLEATSEGSNANAGTNANELYAWVIPGV
jgi:hypothetical protein